MASWLESELYNLKLMVEEEEKIDIEDLDDENIDAQVSDRKITYKKPFKIKSSENNMCDIWRHPKGVITKDLDKNLLVFQFFPPNKDVVLNDGL